MSVAPGRGEAARRILDRDQIVVLGGKPQQRQAAVGMARAQPGERGLGALERVGERLRRYAVWSDLVGAAQDRSNASSAHGADRCYFEVTPCGRPTTVTSMPPSSRRLAMRLVSSSVTASIKADRSIDVIDAEIVELHAHELVRDLGRGIEAKRERAFEVGLGLLELIRGRAFPSHARDLGLDHLDRVLGGVVAGGGAADMDRGMIEPEQVDRRRRRRGRASRAPRDRAARRTRRRRARGPSDRPA